MRNVIFFFFNIYLDKKRSTSSDVGNKVQRMARSRRAMNFAQWSFFGGRKEEVLTEDLSAELSIRRPGKGVVVFFPPTNGTIFLWYFRLLEGGRRKTSRKSPLFSSALHLMGLGCAG